MVHSGVPWHAPTRTLRPAWRTPGTRLPWLGSVLSCCFFRRPIELLLESAHGQFHNPCCAAKAFGTGLPGSDGAVGPGLSPPLSQQQAEARSGRPCHSGTRSANTPGAPPKLGGGQGIGKGSSEEQSIRERR